MWRKTFVAVAIFLAIGALSYNFDSNLIPYMVNQNTYFSAIAAAYGFVLIVFAFAKNRATDVVLLVMCYFFLVVAMPYINSTFYNSMDWERFFHLNNWMVDYPPSSWTRALPLDDATNKRFLYYIFVPTLISRPGLFR